MKRSLMAPVAALGILFGGSATADWSCQIAEVCMAGDMCRQPPEPISARVMETSEAWLFAPEGMPSRLLNLLTERRAVPLVAVSAQAQGFDDDAPSATSVVITADGTLTVTEIDLGPGVAIPMVYRGRCTAD